MVCDDFTSSGSLYTKYAPLILVTGSNSLENINIAQDKTDCVVTLGNVGEGPNSKRWVS